MYKVGDYIKVVESNILIIGKIINIESGGGYSIIRINDYFDKPHIWFVGSKCLIEKATRDDIFQCILTYPVKNLKL